ncbi:MAG: SDR family NAD(P)-dependent oxidoreductase [Bacteroidales bacterium]
MKNRFNGKVVWVTGASSGIGEALVCNFMKRGSTVIASSNEPAELDRVLKNCVGLPGKMICAPFDLSDTSGIEQIADEQVATTGGIDYLINLGGISQRAAIVDTPLWLDRKIMEINYFGTIALTKAVLPHMIRQKSGHILATSSISGRFGFPLRSAYSASKQAIHGFFETLHLENKKNNIRASVIIPGRVRTKISLRALDAQGREHGKMDAGQEAGITPEKAADQIIRGIIRNNREILVGSGELIMLYIRRYLPWLFFRIADRIRST